MNRSHQDQVNLFGQLLQQLQYSMFVEEVYKMLDE